MGIACDHALPRQETWSVLSGEPRRRSQSLAVELLGGAGSRSRRQYLVAARHPPAAGRSRSAAPRRGAQGACAAVQGARWRPCQPFSSARRGLHRRRSQRRRGHQPGDRHGSFRNAAPCAVAQPLPRTSSGADGAGLAREGRRHDARRSGPGHCPAQPFVRRAWARVNEERAMAKRSAGILMFRHRGRGIEVLLMHPGGPFWAKKDDGAWSIPKGEYEDDDARACALREFEEELGSPLPADAELTELGSVKLKSGKQVTAFAVEGDLDADAITSNMFTIEWPPRSGRMREFPEVDRAGWFDLEQAGEKLNPAQAELLVRLAPP